VRPRAILDIIQAASELRFAQDTSGSVPAALPKACTRCGYMTSQVGACAGVNGYHLVAWSSCSRPAVRDHSVCCPQKVCKACTLLEGLNRGLPGLGIRRTKQDATSAETEAT
jgi:hypothetical protein